MHARTCCCLQGSDCNRPASPATGAPGAGSCFFDPCVKAAINQQQLAPGVPLHSFTIEEAEFAVPLKHLQGVIADLRAMAAFGDGCWPAAFLALRPGGPTPDLIGPASGEPWERFMWIELAIFRPNIPVPAGAVTPTPPGPPYIRVQKKLAGLQEAFEQLMVCK